MDSLNSTNGKLNLSIYMCVCVCVYTYIYNELNINKFNILTNWSKYFI